MLSGLSEEVANRVRAESQAQVHAMLHKAHAAPVQDLKDTLDEVLNRLRNAERFHVTQFDKLAAEAKRVRELNVLGLPEINTTLAAVEEVLAERKRDMTKDERSDAAAKVVQAMSSADDTLAAIGL